MQGNKIKKVLRCVIPLIAFIFIISLIPACSSAPAEPKNTTSNTEETIEKTNETISKETTTIVEETTKTEEETTQTTETANPLFSQHNMFTEAKDTYDFTISYPDNFNYEMTSEEDSLNVVFNSLDENTAYSLVIQVLLKNHQYYPNNDEELDSLMDELSSVVGTSEWTKSEPQISNKKLADGTEYREYIYYVTDKQQGEFKWILSPIYKLDRLYIFIGFSHETYYKDFDSAYYESLSTLNFTK